MLRYRVSKKTSIRQCCKRLFHGGFSVTESVRGRFATVRHNIKQCTKTTGMSPLSPFHCVPRIVLRTKRLRYQWLKNVYMKSFDISIGPYGVQGNSLHENQFWYKVNKWLYKGNTAINKLCLTLNPKACKTHIYMYTQIKRRLLMSKAQNTVKETC